MVTKEGRESPRGGFGPSGGKKDEEWGLWAGPILPGGKGTIVQKKFGAWGPPSVGGDTHDKAPREPLISGGGGLVFGPGEKRKEVDNLYQRNPEMMEGGVFYAGFWHNRDHGNVVDCLRGRLDGGLYRARGPVIKVFPRRGARAIWKKGNKAKFL